MPSDIRSFFGGKGGQDLSSSQPMSTPKKEAQSGSKRASGRAKRKVLSDSEDDFEEPSPKKSTPKKAAPKRKESPKPEETTSSAYFASKKKPTRSTPNKSKPTSKKQDHPAVQRDFTPKKASTVKDAANSTPKNGPKSKTEVAPSPARSTRSSARKPPGKSYAEPEDSDDIPILKQDDSSGEDIYGAEFKRGKKGALDDYESDGDAEDVMPARKGKGTANGRKRKSAELSDDDAAKPFTKKVNGSKSTPSKPAAKPRRTPAKKKQDEPENAAVQDIFDNIPTVRAPTPPPRDPKGKFGFTANAARSQPAPNAGTKEIPTGAEDCLAGLTFVFTGVLDALGREEGQELVKRYGGKVTGVPSSKTSYVVLGEDAGPKKLGLIKQFNLKTINEDGLFALIKSLPAQGGSGKAASKAAEKKQAEEKKIQADAEKMAKELAAEEKKKAAAASASGEQPKATGPKVDDELWTVKYAPTQLNQICGNKAQVEKLQNWLRNWPKSAKFNFKKGGPDGSGLYRAVILHGGPGIGKTTAAHLVAKLEGYDVVESNASDTRSKKLIETGLKGVLDTTSLMGYFAGAGQKIEATKRKLVLIMDEVDGMSAGDRGGVGAMASICRKTNIPIILICNDRKLPKMKPFDHVTYELPFRKPTTDMVRSRIMTILFREGMSKLVPTTVVNALIEGAGADIRRVINMISTAKLDQQAMDFDEGKKMTSAWEKHVMLKPWDITQKILAGGMFAQSSRSTLQDKIELYFDDHDFSPLMLQENYLITNPIRAHEYSGRRRDLEILDLVDKAANSISDGDLVDSMIHGSQQQWSLMPTHAVFSFVRPASFVAGSTGGNRVQFTSWLGNNSKMGKLSRYIKEIQGHMRLRASGDRHEIRQQYLPVLWMRLVKALELHGDQPGGIERVIELMDSYFLTKDDWDAMLELGLGPQAEQTVKVGTATKSAFTRKYNAASHPLPFMKASAGTVPPAAKRGKDKPDLEEAIEESDEEEVLVDIAAEDEDEELDLKKDKYVRVPKKKKAAGGAAAGKGGKKGKAKGDDEEDVDESEEPAPKKAKAKAKAKGKGKAKK